MMEDVRRRIIAVFELCNGQDVMRSEYGYVESKEEAIDRFIKMLEEIH